MGHWEKDGDWFWNEDEVLRDCERAFYESVDGSFEDWIDDNYRASTIFEARDDPNLFDNLLEEFYQEKWAEIRRCIVEGEDFDELGVTYVWVENDDEDDEDDDDDYYAASFNRKPQNKKGSTKKVAKKRIPTKKTSARRR